MFRKGEIIEKRCFWQLQIARKAGSRYFRAEKEFYDWRMRGKYPLNDSSFFKINLAFSASVLSILSLIYNEVVKKNRSRDPPITRLVIIENRLLHPNKNIFVLESLIRLLKETVI